MKIAFYDPYLDTLGGGEKYVLKAAKCFEDKDKPYLFWEKSEEGKIKERAKQRFNIDLSEITFVPNIFKKNISAKDKVHVQREYDAIFYLSDGSIPFLPFAKKLIIHFQFPVEWVKKDLITTIKLLKVTKVVCNSEYTKKYIDRKFGIKSIVIYPPSQIISSKKTKKENIILTAGRYAKIIEGRTFKKHDFLIKVFKEMVDKGIKDWEFHVAIIYKDEDKEEVKKIEEFAKNYPIIIHKNIADDKIKDLYSKAKIYWHAAGFGEDLIRHPEYAEHFGITTVEAMSYGAVPVVVNAGGQTEIVENEKSGFLWDTKEQLIDFTFKLIKDKNFLEKLSQNAILRSSLFSEENFNRKLREIIG